MRYGYTGQEEMPEFGLVNLNARLYDPMLGRFLSPDNFVQCPDYSQNYNRYSYCVNNPLKYNDPSGNVFQLALAALAAYQSGMTSWANGGSFSRVAIMSFAPQCASYGIGELLGHSTGSFWNEALRAGAHGFTQGALSAFDGENFSSGFAAGALSSAAGSYAQYNGLGEGGVMAVCTITGSLAFGLVEGGNGSAFLSGAQIGFNVGALNHTAETPDWYKDDDGNVSWHNSCEPTVKSGGKILKNIGHTFTDEKGRYHSLFGQIISNKGLAKKTRLIDEAIMKMASWEERKLDNLPSVTDFRNTVRDTGFQNNHTTYFDYGGGTKNASITYRTNPNDMIVNATVFKNRPLRGVSSSAYNIRFSPRDCDPDKMDVVRVWFTEKMGNRNYQFYQKLKNSYKR